MFKLNVVARELITTRDPFGSFTHQGYDLAVECRAIACAV
jgi:hypothetical protein